jgi:hypothetical protein
MKAAMKAANATRGIPRIVAACLFAASARERECVHKSCLSTDESMFCQTHGIDV